ncbi:MAG: 1-acyl-sn-glycerol-3-phosphate acyltransferase [Bacteroidetes bacterium]|nr:MAG: 1-acyl-sn-glycerol-3-phosphate acyltransferase [Bacteroidota bacterium]
MKKILRTLFITLWKSWFALVFSLTLIVLYPLFVFLLVTKQHKLVYRLKQVWAFLICLFSGLIPHIRYPYGKFSFPSPSIVVANHTSYLDILFSVFYIKKPAVFMGKAELLEIPLFNIFFKYFDIPVRRQNPKDAVRAFEKAAEWIDKGYCVIIYPEGTISPQGKLKPFKNGAFRLAIQKKIPIVPAVNLNNWHLLENGGFFKSNGFPGIAHIVVGKPIDTSCYSEKNLVDLQKEIRTFIEQQLNLYYEKNK